jgi:hypothetical protein
MLWRSMARFPACPFCQKRTHPPTREDIFARWMAKYFPTDAGPMVVIGWDHHKPTGEEWYGRPGKKGNMGFIVKKPCKACNNGWMSRLETKAEPIMWQMIVGNDTVIPSGEQLTLARWLLKTAMAWEFFRKRSPKYFKPMERLAMAQEQPHLPPHILFFLARYRSIDSGNAGFFAEYDLPLAFESEGRHVADAYVSTFAIGELALQIFAHRLEKTELRFHIKNAWTDAEFRFAHSLRTIRWPPKLALSDDSIEVFHRRWLTLHDRPT